MSHIVFIGGIHGSGKTTLSVSLAALVPAAHITAGRLIREAAAPGHVVTVGAQGKAVPDVDANQAVLLRGLAAYRARNSGDLRVLLLDGHFSLMNASGGIEDVAIEVFKAIAPVALLLVEAPSVTVYRRLASRAGSPPSVDAIERLAERERDRALTTATDLRIPLWSVTGDGTADDEAPRVVERIRALRGAD
jgi:adenylate kinase